MKMNSQQSKTYGNSEGSPEREVHSDTVLLKKDRNISNKQPKPMPTRFEEQQLRQPRTSRRKEITRIRADLNDIETKSTILRTNDSSRWFFGKINKIDKPLSRRIKKKKESK